MNNNNISAKERRGEIKNRRQQDRELVANAMRGILSDETATVQQKLEAATILGEITGMRFTPPVNEKIDIESENRDDN